MESNLHPDAIFDKPPRCSNSSCVEVAITAGSVLVRGGQKGQNGERVYTHEEWRVFMGDVIELGFAALPETSG